MPSLTIPCRSGRAFEFDPSATALVVIDMQKDFFTGDGESMLDTVPCVAALTGWARTVGCTVIHTREGYRPDMSDVSAFRRSLNYVGRDGPLGRFLIRGEPGHDFLDVLKPRPGETVIDKAGFSAFHDTGLHQHLSAAGIDHLILCGVTTQCCVHSTLRDAVDLGYWCLTVADCCAASEPGLHEAALRLIEGEGHLFGWICSAADATACHER
ncbi:MAG: cysteine hydrolase [Alphaproteobacteria bacterium]